MSIDINQPVEKGHDMVLNNPDGTQELGTAQEFTKRKDAGDLSGLHTNPAEPASEPVEKVEKKSEVEGDVKDTRKTEPDKSNERLSDEQNNRSAEDRTEGEVEQTEQARDEADDKKQDEPVK